MKKIRIYDNGNGLLVSTKDLANYLVENGIITKQQRYKICWEIAKVPFLDNGFQLCN